VGPGWVGRAGEDGETSNKADADVRSAGANAKSWTLHSSAPPVGIQGGPVRGALVGWSVCGPRDGVSSLWREEGSGDAHAGTWHSWNSEWKT